jgi:glycerate-2-kinase
MSYIKNIKELSKNKQRSAVLSLVESAYKSIDPKNILDESILYNNGILTVQNQEFILSKYKKIYLLGIGKGSSYISDLINIKLEGAITKGFAIDLIKEDSKKIKTTIGSHPLPSEINFDFATKMISEFNGLSSEDLVITIICGGGSSLFEYSTIGLEDKIKVENQLLHSSADIYEINTLRKHISLVKGGNFAKICYPATVIDLVFSDVLGNDLSFIASGPMVYDETTKEDAINIAKKYQINIDEKYIKETPKDKDIFINVKNFLILTNMTPLRAMKKKAQDLGLDAFIYSDRVNGIARDLGCTLIENCPKGKILLAGGETTVLVKGKGLGGRNQEVVAGAFKCISKDVVICSFGSDGWDNYFLAGAIADSESISSAKKEFLEVDDFLKDNNTLPFFQKIGDGINTGKLPSNVSDLMIVYRFAT